MRAKEESNFYFARKKFSSYNLDYKEYPFLAMFNLQGE
jgi:hypothetical protein